MKAFVFPGQGAQFTGMGKLLYDTSPASKTIFDKANEVLGFELTKVMFEGEESALKQTKITQPAVFTHSIAAYSSVSRNIKPDMVAGHSLGEFSALVANKTLEFEDALKLVYKRALAMQEACELEPSTMAAIIGLDDNIVVEVCNSISDEIVVAANFNCPGQLVISGSLKGIDAACEKLKEAGARRAMILNVGGAFHSPLMEPARVKLEEAILKTHFSKPECPVYQNYTATAVSDPAEIQKNLIAQLTAPVKWTQSVEQMLADGATEFMEIGPGKVLQGLIRKVSRDVNVGGVQ
ncbi:MAG: [acyl-carrier-protein] S-malonyltransferase [Chitinophagaceae bacterium]|nr:MAG: [acyl-carrier-protein] S-malonyltransferase [Chitinophagaceae bacterium]